MSAGDDTERLQKAAGAIRSLRARVQELETAQAPPVAIVGMGCRLPGARDPAAYWQLLREGRSGTREIPADRWDVDAFHDPDAGAAGRMTCREGGFLDDIAGFDAAFFGISPREARRLDPQQRLLLEVGWEALEHATIDPRGLAGSRTGVFVGIAEAEYLQLMRRDSGDPPEMYDLTGTSASVASGRLSYHLGLQGPNIALDTACSSSLVAIHLAIASLRRRESDMALAGGVNLMLLPETFVAFCRGGALAPDGRCKAFDARADGYGRGEGCGIVVLKRLDDALTDGDRVLAVIRGSAVNQDGRTNGLTAPDGLAQQAVIRAALADAGVAPAEVGYVETHGTGTQLGDPIEAHALGAVFGAREQPLLLGAAKTNIGHLEAAAGVAGLIKAVLVLQHSELPPNLHFDVPNPLVDWARMALRVPTQTVSLAGGPPIAGVSSFGFSGTNAHLVLEAAPDPEPRPSDADRPHHVFALSAQTSDALAALARRHAKALTDGDAAFGDVCFTARTGRASFPHRLAVVAASGAECAASLELLAGGERSREGSIGYADEPPRIAFLFAGQGSQYAGMGRGLYEREPLFRSTIDRCDAVLRDSGLLDTPLIDVMHSPADIDRTAFAQPALFALECATAELWRSQGVEPDVLLGHSTGEYAAACVAGALSLEDGVLLVGQRARLVASATTGGATAAVFASAERVAELLAPFAGVGVAAINGPRETVIAGAAEAVREAREALKRSGMDSRSLKVPHAPHSPLVEPILDEFEQFARGFRFGTPRIALVSNVTGARVDVVNATHWRRHLREPVRFAEGIATVAAEGCGVLLEVGPQPVLQLLGRQAWNGGDTRWLTSLWEGHDDARQMLHCARDLYVAGVDIDWKAFDGDHAYRKVDLPTYPFERSRHWFTERDELTRPVGSAMSDVAARPPRPAGSVVDELTELVADLVETERSRVPPRRSFIELGADSLLIARLVQEIEDRYGVIVGIGRLFDDLDTIAALAAHIVELGGTPRGARTAPPPASELTTPATPVLPATAQAGDDVARLVDRQLDLMARQLELLSGAAPRDSAAGRPAARRAATPPGPAPAVAIPPSDLDPARRKHLDDLLARYAERTAGSRRRSGEHDAHRVDTRLRIVRPETRAVAYPIVGERADGARFWDIDGNEYVDIAMGVGVLLCGHNPPFVGEAVAQQMRRGLQTGPISDLADEVAATICEMTGMERLFFAVTGTSAVQGALRVAQAATGRSRFAMFSGSYHGQDDRVLAVADVLDDPTSSLPSGPGISPAAAGDALVLTYGSDRALEQIEAHAGELAAVLVEPVQSRNPALQPAEFLRELRELTLRIDVPLIFDEVITGFRMHPGGAQAWFGVQADIAAYGKCLGGGLPVSVVAGAARYLDHVDGGGWTGRQDAAARAERTYIGSTFEMHPTAMAATRAMLRHLCSEGPALQERLNARTQALADELNSFFADEGVPISVLHFGSLFRFAWKRNASYAYQPLEIEVFHLHLVASGIYIWEGRTCFLSTAHTPADIAAIVAAAKDAVAEMRAGSFLPATLAQPFGAGRVLPASVEQRALLAFRREAEPDVPDWSVAEHLRLDGPLRLDALRGAARSLVARHEALRTVFAAGRDEQLVRSDVDIDVELVERLGVDEAAWDGVVAGWLERELARPFDLEIGPLLRVFAVRLREDVHHLVLVAHHIVCDGWSMTLMLGQLAGLYRARCENVVAELDPPLQYGDFVARQDEQRDTSAMAEHQSYWTDLFPAGFPAATLATGGEMAARRRHAGARCHASLEPELCAAVAEAGRTHRCSLFMTLLAAHSLVVCELTGSSGTVVGTPTAGRPFKGAETIVGYCTHLLAMRASIAPETTIDEHLAAVRRTVLGAFAHQDLPFALHASTSPDESLGSFALDTIFNLDRSVTCPTFYGLTASFRRVPAAFALVPLRLDALEVDGALWLDCDYDTELLDEPLAMGFLAAFRGVLEQLVRDPSRPARDRDRSPGEAVLADLRASLRPVTIPDDAANAEKESGA